MKIYLLSNNDFVTDAWEKYFKHEPEVEVICGDFYPESCRIRPQCVATCGNSFGQMDGGYDASIGSHSLALAMFVKEYINEHYYGEQPVGTSFYINLGKSWFSLIHTPTMREPEFISDPMVVYHCMRSTLICALENNVESIMIPAFGAGTGHVQPEVVAKLMYEGYKQIKGFIANKEQLPK